MTGFREQQAAYDNDPGPEPRHAGDCPDYSLSECAWCEYQGHCERQDTAAVDTEGDRAYDSRQEDGL